jgi:hypothetical protein
MQQPSAGVTSSVANAWPDVHPDDLRLATALCREALMPLVDADWERPANGLEWTCRRTLQHIANALDWYGLLLIAPSSERLPSLGLRYVNQSIAEILEIVQRRAAVLRLLTVSADPSARGYHSWGRPDRSGYVAMGCAEILLHTDDIAQGLGQVYRPPDDALCTRVVRRLFPWAPAGMEGWTALQWALGRLAVPEHGRVPSDWVWHASPVAAWDGEVKTRESYHVAAVAPPLPRAGKGAGG